MPVRDDLGGLWAPVATPFDAHGAPDEGRLTALGRKIIADGARGLVLLGTTGEANSIGLGERHRLIDATVAAIDPHRLIIGTGAASVDDAAVLTRHAGEVQAAGTLLLPPFYYKDVGDDGLFAFVAEVATRTGTRCPPILLYHYPALAGTGWSFDLIGRLLREFPGIVVGIKDSSGDEAHTLRLIQAFPALAVFPGSEKNLVTAAKSGAVGFVTASANVNARALAALLAEPAAVGAAEQLAEANAVRVALKARGLLASVKAVLARQFGDDAWLAMRPPLLPLTPSERASLYAEPPIARLLAATAHG